MTQKPSDLPSDFDRAVRILLRIENRTFLTGIRIMMSNDPQFMVYHGGSVGLKVTRLLREHGVNWNIKVIEANLEHLLRNAFTFLDEAGQ